MSLDVRLYKNYHVTYDNGKTLESKQEEVYNANITHNLGEMASEAGLYEALWRPHKLKEVYSISENDYISEYNFEKSNPVIASEITLIIEKGLEDMKARPEHYKTFDSPNGWGIYDHFIPFIEKYLEALKEHPESIVECCR
tara:strand:+ start:5024 stop:5446 length:423 start_codon:yes stop_codon:yes gene_type:complete